MKSYEKNETKYHLFRLTLWKIEISHVQLITDIKIKYDKYEMTNQFTVMNVFVEKDNPCRFLLERGDKNSMIYVFIFIRNVV